MWDNSMGMLNEHFITPNSLEIAPGLDEKCTNYSQIIEDLCNWVKKKEENPEIGVSWREHYSDKTKMCFAIRICQEQSQNWCLLS